MTISRTINYTQNVPISLGFNNYLTNTSTSSIEFSFSSPAKAMMGFISVTPTPGVTVTNQSYSTSTSSPYFIKTTLTGTMADLNTALNTAMFQNHFYEAETLSQDFVSQNRTLPSDYRGELQIQINPNVVHGLTVGGTCKLSSPGYPAYTYTVTKIDSVNSPTRIWLSFTAAYDISTKYYSNAQTHVGIANDAAGNTIQTGTVSKVYNSYYLQTSAGVNIAPIVDISYNNPCGNFLGGMMVYSNTSSMLEGGTFYFVGSPFAAEPTFSTSATAITSYEDTFVQCNLGQIAQVDNNHQSVQVLMKYAMNDPQYLNVSAYTSLSGYPTSGTLEQQLQFIGDAIHAKASLDIPRYIPDTYCGVFTMDQVNESTSVSPSSGVVRWHFYGTPDECNLALKNLYYYRPAGFTKDFNVEVRIVNGRTRIYGSRGL